VIFINHWLGILTVAQKAYDLIYFYVPLSHAFGLMKLKASYSKGLKKHLLPSSLPSNFSTIENQKKASDKIPLASDRKRHRSSSNVRKHAETLPSLYHENQMKVLASNRHDYWILQIYMIS
jgi:hypothetical protein